MRLGSSPVDDFRSILLACHGRIRALLPSLDALIGADPGDPRAEATCDGLERYLRQALPLHAQDEDLSLMPRLLRAAPDGDTAPDEAQPAVPDAALLVALETMEAEHDRVDSGRRAFIASLCAWRASGDTHGLRSSRAFLTDLLIPHIDAEERDIFPAMARLSAAELDVMLDELRSRRRE